MLECACGTGLFFLPLLAAGHDMHGFDISRSMLSTLQRKASDQYGLDVSHRLTVQDFENFHYDEQFAAIIIATNSFGMLTTQEAQIRALRNMYAHLVPGGKLLLDLRLAGIRSLFENSGTVEGQWYTWTHPETGRPIRQRVVGNMDPHNQLILDHCFIEYEGQAEDFPMTGRWIFKDEFQLLLRVAGFERWECYATPELDPLQTGLEETFSYWIVPKAAWPVPGP